MHDAQAQVTLQAINDIKLDIDNEISQMRMEFRSILEEMNAGVKVLAQAQRNGGVTLNNTHVAKAVRSVQTIGKNITNWTPGQYAGLEMLQPPNIIRRPVGYAGAGRDERSQDGNDSRPDSPFRHSNISR